MIDVGDRDDIRVLTLSHGKASALDIELCGAVADRLEESRSASCSAIVMTGRGAIFSAGVDLVRLVDGGPRYAASFLPALRRVLEAVFTFPKPLVAAVNGHAIAGGCVLACAADRRLMARGPGRIGMPELLVGVPFPSIVLEIVRFASDPRHLSHLVLGGATMTADDAAAHGLVDDVTEPGSLLDDAVAAARMLAARPAHLFAMTKRQLRAPALERVQKSVADDAQVDAIWSSPATIDAVRGYIDRTFRK